MAAEVIGARRSAEPHSLDRDWRRLASFDPRTAPKRDESGLPLNHSRPVLRKWAWALFDIVRQWI
jgi:hypothetical protein